MRWIEPPGPAVAQATAIPPVLAATVQRQLPLPVATVISPAPVPVAQRLVPMQMMPTGPMMPHKPQPVRATFATSTLAQSTYQANPSPQIHGVPH